MTFRGVELGDPQFMTKKEALCLLRDVRADYVAVMKECDTLRKRYLPNPDPFRYDNLPILRRLDKGIKDLEMATV